MKIWQIRQNLKFVVLSYSRLLDKAPDGTIFIVMCFLVRSVDAVGFAASITASFSVLAKAFPDNIATAMVSHLCITELLNGALRRWGGGG